MKKRKRSRRRRYSRFRFKVTFAFLTLVSLVVFYFSAVFIIHYFQFSRRIAERLQGERQNRPSWVYARPFELREGQRLLESELIEILNALRYQETRSSVEQQGTFYRTKDEIRVHLRHVSNDDSPHILGVSFSEEWVRAIREFPDRNPLRRVEFEPVPVTTLFGEERAKQRWVPLKDVPEILVQAVLATEDRRFFEHTGLDPIGIVRAAWLDIRSGEIQQGGSTLSQQLVKNYFLTPERTIRRKLLEAFLAVILESRATKDEILELYLNDVYLGQRGSFGISGVGQASNIYFSKDVKNLGLEEAALLAALIRAPNTASPFRHPEEAKARRDAVLRQMARHGFIDPREAEAAAARPLRTEAGAVDIGEAPYFVDVLRQELFERYPPESTSNQNLVVHSTMDRHLQNAAQRAVAEGLVEIEDRLAGNNKPRNVQAALIAMQPSSGDVLALVGGRSYGTSQFNRATEARRQPGSAFKPFVYLAAFERSYEVARAGGPAGQLFSPASMVSDVPTTFRYQGRSWAPSNYDHRFAGDVTYRYALSRSLNVATARVGQEVGYERVVRLWDAIGTHSNLQPYPSVVLGAFEMTPLDLATAYTVIANHGVRVDPRFFVSVQDERGRILDSVETASHAVAHPESAYIVTDMMQSVIDEGTAREIRARGFNAMAAGKTGTTNDTRDAWFVGFTPDVLAVVWVGYDNNRPLGLTGSQAALPIWTRFMKAAVSGRETASFEPPAGVTFARIDTDTGLLARPSCPRVRTETFITGSEPRALCARH
ncbi:MAG TPA: PBP1A family penicillin-binding protein [Vicinamibacteria bacterium]